MTNDASKNNGVEHVDGFTESLNSIPVDCESPEDTTIRPARFDVRRFWPNDIPFPTAAPFKQQSGQPED